MNELITIDSYCYLNKTSLTFKKAVTQEEWLAIFKSLKIVEGCVQFWIGDCLAYREQRWGMYDDVAEETGMEVDALRKYKTISEQVKSGTRVPELTWTHHREVAFLPPEKQELKAVIEFDVTGYIRVINLHCSEPEDERVLRTSLLKMLKPVHSQGAMTKIRIVRDGATNER